MPIGPFVRICNWFQGNGRQEIDPGVNVEMDTTSNGTEYVPVNGRWPPPAHRISAATNSFMYMPLFLDAVGLLSEADAAAWRVHPLKVPASPGARCSDDAYSLRFVRAEA